MTTLAKPAAPSAPLRALSRWGKQLLASLALASAVSGVQAQENLIISDFNTEDSAAAWTRWWGGAVQTYSWDGTVNDPPTDPNSGSLKSVIEFDLAAYGGDNQFALIGALPETINAGLYTNLVMNLQWDPASPKTPAGNFGYLEYGFRNADFSQTWLGGMNVPGDVTGWQQISAPISAALPKLDQVTGVVLKMWSGDPVTGMTGAATFWLDNVTLLANTNTAPVPPPTLSLVPAQSGLQLFASAAAQYQRQNIRTVDSGFSWVGRTEPVSYSITTRSYPDGTHSGFQTHLFLVPSETPPTESSPDWNQPNVVFLEIGNNANGGAYANLRYKTNQPNGNSMYYNANPDNGPVGSLGSVGSATPIGTWTLTFTGDTQVTLTSPDGSTTTMEFPAESAALFADPLYAFVGVQPNQLANIGQSVVFGEVKFTGMATPLTDNFVGVPPEEGGPNQLDPAKWGVVAEDPTGVYLVPQDAAYWAWWTLPSTGYSLQQSSSLSATWQAITETTFRAGPQEGVLLPSSSLPAGAANFYRLNKAE